MRWCNQVSVQAVVNLLKHRALHARSSIEGISLIDEVTVIHCALAQEAEILNLARDTTCRLMMRDVGEYCRKFYDIRSPIAPGDLLCALTGPIGCCQNERYRICM